MQNASAIIIFMPAIHIRNVPSEVVEALKRRAASNERSLQAELRLILAKVAQQVPPAPSLKPISLHFSATDTQSAWRREEIYDDDGR